MESRFYWPTLSAQAKKHHVIVEFRPCFKKKKIVNHGIGLSSEDLSEIYHMTLTPSHEFRIMTKQLLNSYICHIHKYSCLLNNEFI